MIHDLDKSTTKNLQTSQQNTNNQNQNETWVTFTYSSPFIWRVTNIFRNTNIQISFRTTNKLSNLLRPHTDHLNKHNRSGIYKINCGTCNKLYTGQAPQHIKAWFNEHLRYIKHNNPNSAYAQHIFNNRHNFGTMQDTLQLLKTCTKRKTYDLLGKLLHTVLSTTWLTHGWTTGQWTQPLIQPCDQ